MGREIRRVPPNWQHPTDKHTGHMQPMFDRPYLSALKEWIQNHQLWEEGKHPDQLDGTGSEYRYFAQWSGNPPDVKYYRPDWMPTSMTWWQVYETVSEGTPVSPPFETAEELIECLVANGGFWDQKRRAEGRSSMPCGPWSRESAERFVKGAGCAPSFVYTPETGFMDGVRALGAQP